MERKYSTKIADAITKFLKEDNWHYQFDEKDGTVKMGLRLEGELDHVDICIHVYDDSFTVSAVSPIKVKKNPQKRREMAEFICRANYGLMCGGFQYDIRDGEVLYKVGILCQGITPTQEMVEHSLYIPALMLDKYSGGMFAVLYGGASAEDAVNTCEGLSEGPAEIFKVSEVAMAGDDDELIAELAEVLETASDDDVLASHATCTQTIRVDPFSEEGDNS